MTMAFDQIDREKIRDLAIRKAVEGLVRASTWGQSYLITMPLVYPSGSAVGVKVTPERGSYLVSDFGMGFREAEGFEAQRSFGAHAGRLKDRFGVDYEDHEIKILANERQISSAIRRVACASHRSATKAFNALPEMDGDEIGLLIYERLRKLFGDAHQVMGKTKVAGASSIDWSFAAEVKYQGRQILFDAVVPHRSSVVSAKSKFSDIRRLGPSVHPIAVVDNIERMGKWLPLISQEAEVIEGGVSEDVLRRVVAEAA